MFHFFRSHRPQMHEHHHHRGGGGRGPKMFDAGALRYVVLQLIAEKERHGYEIIKELELRAGGSYTPSPGAIYPLLAMLADMGQVEVAKDGNKKLYSIAPEGQQFLDQNSQVVEAYMARIAGAGAEEGDDLRSIMHALKEAVISRARSHRSTRERVDQIRAILKRAIDDINQLS